MVPTTLKFVTFFAFIVLIVNPVWADTFVVTSNADSGPGTLREAIQNAAANGTSGTDLITFNIADQSMAGRTIDIASEMPFLTSNLIIDATTQPGSAIGISDARIVIQLNKRVNGLRFFTIRNASNVEIYGLFFFQTYFNVLNIGYNYAIYFRKVNNLVIGKPGKGNYFVNFSKAIANWIDANLPENYLPSDTSNTLVIQSNIFSLSLNGDLTSRTNTINGIVFTPTEYAIYLRNARNVLIGGLQPLERNYINSPNAITYQTDSLSGNGYLRIYGNYIGGINSQGIIDMNGSSETTSGKILLKGTDYWYGTNIAIDIKQNTIGGSIDLGYLNSDAYIQSNTITNTGVFTSRTDDYGSYSYSARITVYSVGGKVMIGGDDPAEGNTISQIRYFAPSPNSTYGQYAIKSYSSSSKGAVEIKNNTIYCNTSESTSIVNGAEGTPNAYTTDTSALWVIIDSTGNGFTRGRASRYSRIDIYLDDECRACEGKQMIGSTFSDATGNWNYTGNFTGVVVATATKRGHTWGFSSPKIISDNAKIQPPTCKQGNGYIKGLKMIGGDNFEWRYSADGYFENSTLFNTTSLDISNLKPGTYYLIGKLGNTCFGWKTYHLLKNYSPKIATQQARITNATCGRFNGSITTVFTDSTDYSKLEWRNSSGLVLGTQKDLFNIGPGTYKLYAIDTTGGGCIDSSTVFTISNLSGPTVNINNVQITNASCNQSNGSIQNIQIQNATGTSSFRWEDSLGSQVGNTIDLLNKKGNKYRLKFKDAGGCDTITTPFFTVENKGGINIDAGNKKVKPSGCNLKNGSITGILIKGGDTFEWKNISTNAVVSTGPDAVNLDSGSYQLSVRNNIGCSQLLPATIVPSSTFLPIFVSESLSKNASCDTKNGFIKNLRFSADTSKYSFVWIDSLSRLPLGSGTSLLNIGSGSFVLQATDVNGCSQSIFKENLLQNPKPTFDTSNIITIADECNQHTGSIKNIKLNNLLGPTKYEWTNSAMTVVGTTRDISLLGSDHYQLKVTDETDCIVTSNYFYIHDNIIKQTKPIYNDTTILRNTPAFLSIKNFSAGNYLLFNDVSVNPIDQNTTGFFTIPNVAADSKVHVEYRKGSCNSDRTEINIKVVDETKVVIPNVFSPNGDGINDLFKIYVTGIFSLKELSIFNREGQKIFMTRDMNLSWDGKYHGKYVPVGTYYYTIEGSDVYNKPFFKQGSITILR